MLRFATGLFVVVVLAPVVAQDSPPAATTRPAADASVSTPRSPTDDAILKELLRERDRTPPPIQPVRIGRQAGQELKPQPVASLGDGQLILEGQTIYARPGRIAREGSETRFLFHAGNDQSMRYEMPINPSSLLELMENEADKGVTEFEVTADVKLYRGRNYLDLRKVVRRVSNNNVAP